MTEPGPPPDSLPHSRPARPDEARTWLALQQGAPDLVPAIYTATLPCSEPGAVVSTLVQGVLARPELTRRYRFDDEGELRVDLAPRGPDLWLRALRTAPEAGPVIEALAAEPWDLAKGAPLRFVLALAPEAARLALIRHPIAADLPESAALLAVLAPQAQTDPEPEPEIARIERIILQTFRAALEAPTMTAHCDFFDMGGHSLVATRVIGQLATENGLALRFADIFTHPTAAALAPLAQPTATPSPAAPVEIRSTAPDPVEQAPLSLAQQSLWKIHAALGFGSAFNIPFVLRFLDPVEETVFAAAFRDLLERHPALRSRFRTKGDTVLQETVPMAEVDQLDWFHPSGPVIDAGPVLAAEAGHVFDLTQELPLRLRFLRTAEGQILSFLFHHVVLDEWSVNLMMDELAHAYGARAAGRAPDWAGPVASFHAFARAQARAGIDTNALDHWVRALREAPQPQPIRAPGAAPLPAAPAGATEGGWCEIAVPPGVCAGLHALAKTCSASLFNTVYAAISVALQRLAGLEALTIGTSAAGRTDPAWFDTIGYFTTVTAHCLRAPGDATPRALITDVRDQITASMPHSEIPIDLVEAALSGGTAPPDEHMFEVFIQIHAQNRLNGALPGPQGPIRFRQVDPEKAGSVLGLQFEVVEDVIEGERGLRVMMSYRHAHYDAADVAALKAAVSRSLAAFADPEAADRTLDALLP
ncbi:condensation domain-containing protein [Rhodobacter sp. TJ_12]|uniref:condensation domain-containing protein n=1 Tax=Rhodobacter sp. TJ_12 TaxID=2029399 RepID=UPI001CBD5379|nr:condensation domain-containing protein [Rhodobacter sp. TJ_12]